MVERFEDIYEFNIAGNYDVELERLQSSIDKARREWLDFGLAVRNSGAALRKPVKLIRELASEGERGAISTAKQRDKMVGLASSSKVLAKAYNQLVREQNRLNIARQSELLALDKARSGSAPRVIEARAEVAALKRLSKGLQELAEKRFFAKKAAEAGFQVSADGKKLFDAEAIAAERAAKAQQELAVQRQLAKLGLDASGQQPLVQNGQLTEAGKLAAQQKANQSLQNLLLREQQLNLKNNNKEWIETEKRVKAAEKQFNQLIGVGEKTKGAFNRVSFTFRRLIGIMAAFTIARQVVNSFNSMIATAIRFNAEIETSRVGLAGLIAASADIRSPTGDRLGIDDQVLRSQDLAIDQMAKLRKQALQTAASYDELAQAFQTAVAPGISAGLGLDQIRDITVLISQAATGLGVAQNQLAEEIRSLFQGTITPRNTRIATALGISNEDIARAKQLGNLFEFLSSRFAAIGKTGKLLLNTFTGQLSNTSDALKQLLAVSSAPLFEQLKAGLRDIQKAIFDTSRSADNIFNEGAITAFRGLFEGLANGVKGLRSAFASIDAESFGNAFAAVGQSLGAIVTALANVSVFLINAATPTVTLFSELLNLLTKASIAVKELTGEFGQWVGDFILLGAKLLFFSKVLSSLIGMAYSFGKLWEKTRKFILGSAAATAATEAATKGASKSMAILAGLTKRLVAPLLIAVGLVALLDLGFAAIGTDFRLKDVLGDAFGFLSNQLDKLLGKFTGLKEELAKPSKTDFGIVSNDFRLLTGEIQAAREELRRLKGEALSQIASSDIARDISGTIAAQQTTNIASSVSKALNADEAIAASREIDKLNTEIVRLERNLKQIRTPEFFEERASLAKQFDDASNAARKAKDERIKLEKAQRSDPNSFRLLGLSKDLEKAKAKEVETLSASEEIQKKLNGLVFKEIQYSAELKASKEGIKNLSEALVSLEEDARRNALVANESLAKDSIRLSEIRIAAAVEELQNTEKTAQAFAEQNALRQDTLSRELDLIRVRQEAGLQEAARLKEISLINLQIETLENAKFEGSKRLLSLAIQQRDARDAELTLEQAINAAREKRAALEFKLAKLRESGSTDQGIGFGLRGFAEDNASLFNTGEQFGRQLGEAIPRFASDGLRSTIAAAFDKTQNIDLSEALADIGAGIAVDLAANLASNLVSNALSGLIQSLGIGIIDTTGPVVAATTAAGIQETAATAAATATTSAAVTAATTVEGGGTAAGVALIAAASKAAATLAGASATASIGGIGQATGGPVNKARRYQFPNLNLTHRNAPGFARGGRPAGIDPRDTVPAFLRPGEWVIRPEAVRLYGDRLFDLLNRGKLSPSALRGVAGASRAPSKAPKIKAGFATGGAVVGAPRQAPSTAPSVSQVIQFHDEQTMERALAAGPNASIRFARSRRGAYRAALGIDPGT